MAFKRSPACQKWIFPRLNLLILLVLLLLPACTGSEDMRPMEPLHYALSPGMAVVVGIEAVALLLTNERWTTIPVFLNRLVSAETGAQYGPKAALGLIALIPVLIFGIAIQRYLVRGLTFGAVKG